MRIERETAELAAIEADAAIKGTSELREPHHITPAVAVELGHVGLAERTVSSMLRSHSDVAFYALQSNGGHP
jgi:hypothetical protein